jgi:hypothetical protein
VADNNEMLFRLAAIEARMEALLDHETRIRELERNQRDHKYVVDSIKKYTWVIASTVLVLAATAGWERFIQ